MAYVLENDFGLDVPQAMRQQVGDYINGAADKLGKELQPNEIFERFSSEFVGRQNPVKLESYKIDTDDGKPDDDPNRVFITAKLRINGEEKIFSATGNGPINSLVMAFSANGMKDFKLIDYRSHAIGKGSATKSAAYICLESLGDGKRTWGVGIDSNIESAGLKGLVCAYNRMR